MDTEVFDSKIFQKAYKRATDAIGKRASHSEIIVFLEKEIDDYRRKLDYAESRIKALCAQQMQNIQIEQKLNKEQKELHKPATLEPMPTFNLPPKTAVDEIIKALADNGYNSITITAYRDQEGKQ